MSVDQPTVAVGVTSRSDDGHMPRPAARSATTPAPGRRWPRRLGLHLAVIAVFSVPAVVVWWTAWSHGAASTVRCSCLDPGQQVWFLEWPAYALSHGLNPLHTSLLWAPHGANLLANASALAATVTMAPITWLVGPFASTTLAMTLAPGLTAWGCWVACRRFSTWPPAWWIGGLLFGYSPFVIDSVAQGHLSTGLLVVPPLMLAVLHEILVRRERSVWWCGVALGALVAVQFLVSAEMLTITVVVAVIGIVACALLAPRRALAALGFATRAFGVAALVTAALLAVPAWYMLAGPQRISGSIWSGAQGLFVAQTYGLWSAEADRAIVFAHAPAGPPLQYLGFGVLAVAALALLCAARRRAAWVMAFVAVVSTVFSWGAFVQTSATRSLFLPWLPWARVTDRPVFDNVSAIHFAATADLAVVMVIVIGLDNARRLLIGQRAGAARGALAGVVAAAVAGVTLVPIWLTYQLPLVMQGIALPPWYATAARHVTPGSLIVTYPFPASASVTSGPMVWQVADGMRFRLAGGYIKVPGHGDGVIGLGAPDSAVRTLDDLTLPGGAAAGNFSLSPATVENLRSALVRWGTAYVVVTDRGPAPVEAAAAFTAVTGRLPRVSHHAWVWDLRADPLGPAPDAAAAAASAATFDRCAGAPRPDETLPADRPLPSSLDRCVAGGLPAAPPVSTPPAGPSAGATA